jgi:hypothetical protein
MTRDLFGPLRKAKPTKAELEVLEEVLEAMRKANTPPTQLHILVDPFALGGGAHLSFAFDPSGYSLEVIGVMRGKRLPRPNARKL